MPSGRSGIPSTGDGGRDPTFDYDAPFADEYIDDLPATTKALAEERETIRIVAVEQIGSAVREAMAEVFSRPHEIEEKSAQPHKAAGLTSSLMIRGHLIADDAVL